MEAEVDLGAFNRAARAVRPALSDARDGGAVVQVHATDRALRLTATGRTMTYRQSIEANVPVEGEVVVPARLLADVVARGTAESFNLAAQQDGDLVVSSGQLKATIRRLSMAAPLPITVAEPTSVGRLNVDELRRASVVASAASRKLERPVLTGVHLGQGVAEATDTYRIARTGLSDWLSDLVVPADVLRHISADGAAVVATFDGRVVEFAAEHATWSCPVLASSFPDLDRHLVGPAVRVFACEREALFNAVETASVLAGAPVHLTGEGDSLRVWSESSQLGLVQTVLPATAEEGHSATFSSTYLHDALKVATGDVVRIELTERFARLSCEEFTQLVMMRVDGGGPESQETG